MTRTAHTPIRTLLCSTAMAATVFVGALQAKDAPQEAQPPASAQAAAPVEDRGQMAMMAEHQKMMAEMAASQKALDELVAKMNAATGQAKVEQMAGIISAMVAHSKQMNGRMMSMHTGMMKKMMQPAQPGTAPPLPDR